MRTWGGTLCCTWNHIQDFTFGWTHVHKCVKKYAFYVAVDDPLEDATKGAREGTLYGAPKDVLSNLHKDAQEAAF